MSRTETKILNMIWNIRQPLVNSDGEYLFDIDGHIAGIDLMDEDDTIPNHEYMDKLCQTPITPYTDYVEVSFRKNVIKSFRLKTRDGSNMTMGHLMKRLNISFREFISSHPNAEGTFRSMFVSNIQPGILVADVYITKM